MSIFCTATINGTDHYVSTDEIADIHMWKSEIVSISQITTSLQYEYGGYLRPIYGTVEFLPTLFEGAWPPPQTISFLVEVGDDEANKNKIVYSECSLQTFTQDKVVYKILGESDGASYGDITFTGKLISVIDWACDALGIMYNTDNVSRVDYFDVNFTNTNKRKIMDILSEACAFASVYFYRDGYTLRFMDMLDSVGSMSLDEFDFTPNTYLGRNDVSLLVGGASSITGSTPSSNVTINVVPWHNTNSNIVSALTDIKTTIEKSIITVEIADDETVIDFGTSVTVHDDSCQDEITGTFVVTKNNIYYSHDTDRLIIEGRGTIT